MSRQQKNVLQKPFLKWVGGKTQIINNIIDKFPKEINNYHEIFLGGGSVLFALLSLEKNKSIHIKGKIYAYDINKDLINVYKNIQENNDTLYEFIEKYMKEYDSIKDNIIIRNPKTIKEAKTSKESYYYWLRNKYNSIDKTLVECSALFMIINKLCFRGMYREGPNGYNVPYGHYKKTPTIITKKELYNINELIKNVIFIHSDFNDSIKNIDSGDFVYLDPPYFPENDKSFVGYTYNSFDKITHQNLFNNIKSFNSKNIKFIMSNSNTEFVLENFKEYNHENINARRAINSKNPGSTTIEIIIYN